ncbi:hypothetical protein NQ314_010253 [Rhamnusium bicolor]|uniref:HTH CENPB-type domain-containing protein n=1 Tax=Rhamnusium bicolor TaxID=1586634 RepID=A0AAV8XTB6_9CUCU|nr:hypothetical protein NQ314_010253 [Rhamnusium bicolor]
MGFITIKMSKEKRTFFKYSEESLNQALKAIRENNTSIREASRLFGVPRATIQDRIKGRVKEGPRQMGRDPVLTKDEEGKIVKWLIDLSRCGFPQRKCDLLDTVEKIVTEDKRPTPFTHNRPGEKWYNCFLKRHPELSLREFEGLTKGRAVVTEQYIRKWFADLKLYLEETNNLDVMSDPDRILNGDESGFNLCPKTGKVLGPKGARNILEIKKGNDRENITTLFVFTASGKTAVPCVVFKYVRIPKAILDSSDPSWHVTKSDSGWMKSHVFIEYVTTKLLPWLQSQNTKFPVIFFVDGHKSHLTMELSQFCHKHDIILYSLPPNTTHLMQPADVGVFKPLKSEWKKIIHQWLRKPENINSAVTKTTFCPLLKTVLEKPSLPQTIINGFKKCGLFPFNPDAPDYTKCVQNHLEKVNELPEHPITAEEIEIAQKVLTNFENRLQDENFESIKELVNKLERFKAHPADMEIVNNERPVQQNPNIIPENPENPDEWIAIEDVPIIFANDVHNNLNNEDQLIELNFEDYLTDEKEVQETMKETYRIVKEHDKTNKNKTSAMSRLDNTSAGSKEIENNTTNTFAEAEKTEAIDISIIREQGNSPVESKSNLKNSTYQLDKKTENSSETNETGDLTITYENKTKQSAERAIDEVDVQELQISTDEENLKLQEDNCNSKIDYEIIPSETCKTESDIVNQLTRLENQKINILQDVRLTTNLQKHLVYPTPITSKKEKKRGSSASSYLFPKVQRIFKK